MSKLRVNTVVNRTNTDKVIFPYGIGVTNGIVVSGVVTATSFVGSGISLTGVQGTITLRNSTDVTGITTIVIGSGLSLTSSVAGIASIGVGTVFQGLVIGVTTIANSGQIRSQSFGNFLPQRVPTIESLDPQEIRDYAGSLVVAQDTGGIFRFGSTGIVHRVVEARHVGVVTATGGFVATGSSVGFTGPLYSTGISTAAFLQATTVNIGSAATVTGRFNALQDVSVTRNLTVSGISTFTTLNATVTGNITGNVNATGISTIAQLISSTINSSGIVTASGGFVGNLTGNVTGDINGHINSSGISTLGTLQVSSINSASGISTIQQLKGDTISITGIITASSFSGSISGNSSGLTGTPDIVVGFVTSKTILPSADTSYDLGAPLMRWNNIYSADMHFSNEGSSNSVDGTWGSWTLQEGEHDLYMLNNRTGKRYKINLTEV